MVDKAGWLHTADMAVLDEKGYCRIVGRPKDVIIRRGENISPREVEEVIHQHKAVMDVQVRFCSDFVYDTVALVDSAMNKLMGLVLSGG